MITAMLNTQLHGRLAAPWTCLVVVFIAIPFGSLSGRRNVLVGVASSILICFVFFCAHPRRAGAGHERQAGALAGRVAAEPGVRRRGIGADLARALIEGFKITMHPERKTPQEELAGLQERCERLQLGRSVIRAEDCANQMCRQPGVRSRENPRLDCDPRRVALQFPFLG